MSLVDAVRAAGSYSQALELTIAHFRAESGTIHMLEADGLLHLKAASRGLPEAAEWYSQESFEDLLGEFSLCAA